MPTGQIVSNEQFTQMMEQATGVPMGQPAQQVFQQPQQIIPVPSQQQGPQSLYAGTPLQAKQQPQQPPMFYTADGNPLFGDPRFREDAKRMNLGNLHAMQAQQLSQVGPPGSEKQKAYEKLATESDAFLHGLVDGSMRYIKNEVLENMNDEDKQKIAEKAIKEDIANRSFWDKPLGHFIIGVGGAVVGYGIVSTFGNFLFGSSSSESDDYEKRGEDIAAFTGAVKTLIS